MNRYSCVREVRDGETICRMRDETLDAEAEVAASFGMNVIRFAARGEDIVLSPPSLQALRERPFRYGIPFLSPPGRTTDGEFRHRGLAYRLPVNVGRHNVHGELGTMPWRIVEQQTDPVNGVSLRACFAYEENARQFAYFPHELVYELTYRLKDGILSLEGEVRNVGKRHAPLAFGFHPYLVWGGDRSDTKLQLPSCESEWPRDGDGRACDLPAPTELAARLRSGITLSALPGAYHIVRLRADPTCETPARACRLLDRAAGRRTELRVSAIFSALVLFLPPWGSAVALEPHTCVPDAFNLPLAESETGAMELAPGASRSFGWSIQTWKEGF